MLSELTHEEHSAALDRCAEDLLWEAAVDAPPVDAFRLARRLGIVVTGDASLAGRARRVGYRRPTTAGRFAAPLAGAIALANEARPERRQWAVAHEVGEHVAHRVFDLLGVDPREASPTARESTANGLAGRLLLPRRWFLEAAAHSGADLLAIKAVFTTASHELVARRLLECWPEPLVVTVFDNDGVTWRRSNATLGPPELSAAELVCQREARLTGEPFACEDRTNASAGGCARCWPLHEPGWRREILVTELSGAFQFGAR
ncbi:hypothetical protein Mal64_08180 [Pseudobythopirellula maris]|uniref:IrrE N-terminal-like domain-containing protein n=1 Tax=Pseudobythopirellula maris TaxID=2527991 RepID=A0A5C5ZSE8_9BACT|nr:ImmA/IrrE family metallo-endopeptidase [Pseudobythopirellula maris]TWT90429.1 hypothetical protein Mal64_08180 [Pseudobythopirellula maris]